MQALLDHLLKIGRPGMRAEERIDLLAIAFKELAEGSALESQRLVMPCIRTMFGIWEDFHCSPTSVSSLEDHPRGEEFMPMLMRGLFMVTGDSPPYPLLITL